MLTVEGLRHYNTGFEIGDMFGKARMKDLIWSFKEQLAEDQGEIERWRTIAHDQAELINKLYAKMESQSREKELQDQNDDLYCQLTRALEMQESLKEYAAGLEKKLEASNFSDLEAYRILKAMNSGKNWKDEEVS